MVIAIIDEHPVFRSGVRSVVNEHFGLNCIFESGDISSFYKEFKNEVPDLIILSINQQAVFSNCEALRLIKKFYLSSATIVYGEHMTPAMVRSYFQLGIAGYLSKMDALNELVTCIKKVLEGRLYVSSDMFYALLEDLPVVQKKGSRKLKPQLTRRQNEIAMCLINGLKTSEISRNLGIKPSTISAIKANIFKKMKVDGVLHLKEAMGY